MAISKAGTDTSDDDFNVGTGGTFTLSHTLVAGDDRKVVSYIAWMGDHGDFSPTGVTYGGNAMTLGSDNDQQAGNAVGQQMWYIDDADMPATGARDCVVTFDSGTPGSFDIVMMYIAQYEDIAQGAPNQTDEVLDSSNPASSPIANTVTAVAADEWALSQFSGLEDAFTLTWNNSQVEQHDGEDGIGFHHQGVAELQGGASETSLNTISSGSDFGIVALRQVAVWGEPAAAGGRNRVIVVG